MIGYEAAQRVWGENTMYLTGMMESVNSAGDTYFVQLSSCSTFIEQTVCSTSVPSLPVIALLLPVAFLAFPIFAPKTGFGHLKLSFLFPSAVVSFSLALAQFFLKITPIPNRTTDVKATVPPLPPAGLSKLVMAAFVFLFLVLADESPALVLWNSTGNTTSVGAGSGWNYTGKVTNGSAVFLGSYSTGYWVLTASHVGASDFTLNGTTYSYIAGSSVRITNPDGTDTDLVVFRVSSGPSLPNLSFASISTGASVTMIGSGFDGASSKTYWDSSWNELPSAMGASHVGYNWLDTYTKRWGTNSVSVSSFTANYGYGNISMLGTTFDQSQGDAQVSTGDSGGGVFTNTGLLAGIMLTTGTYPSQPSETSVVGDQSYFADMSVYGSRILAVIPEPSSVALLTVSFVSLLGFHWSRSRRGH